jgi:hypothetical protein
VLRHGKVPRSPVRWSLLARPHYDNSLATVHIDGDGYEVVWETGRVVAGDHAHPQLSEVARTRVDARPAPAPLPA